MIPVASPLAQFSHYQSEITDAILNTLKEGNYILGPRTASFEQAFASYCQAKHCVGLNSGTDALILAIRALGIGPGDEVVTVSHTAVATVAAIIAAGATPCLVDIDAEYYTLDPEKLAAAITPRTRAIIAVHLYGQAADLDSIMAIAGRHGIPVIEDCAQATGGFYKGRRVGSTGVIGCFSFYPTKNLGAIGDGGAVVTSDPQLFQKMRELRQYGWNDQRKTAAPGINSRLDEIQAAILSVKLPHLDADNRRRIAIADRYSKAFSELPVTVPKLRSETTHVYHLYVIQHGDRDSLRNHLATAGVSTGIHYSDPAHRHGGYDKIVHLPGAGLPVTDTLVGRILTLPLYPELSDDDVNRVITAMQTYNWRQH